MKPTAFPKNLFQLTTFFLLLFMGSLTQDLSAQSAETDSMGCVLSVDQQAQPKGGMAAFYGYVMEKFNYPKRCQAARISGYVLLRFVVDTDGSISNVTAIESTAACPEFAEEAIRVLLASPKWIPAQSKGKPAKAYRKIPIKFEAVN